MEDPADEQRRAWMKLSAIQKLEWLQQAKTFAAKYGGAVLSQTRPPR
jgi:hypothetical protein